MKREILDEARRIVVKVSSFLIVEPPSMERIIEFAHDISSLVNEEEREVLLTSSGAIACGRMRSALPGDQEDLVNKQAYAAKGQGHLMRLYEKEFERYGLDVAQLLLTRDSIDMNVMFENRYFHEHPHVKDYLISLAESYHPTAPLSSEYIKGIMSDAPNFVEYFTQQYNHFLKGRYNLINTANRLLQKESRTVPIANENDTIATEEITFGDNDPLAAHLACALEADLVVNLTKVDGIYNPCAEQGNGPERYIRADDIGSLAASCSTEATQQGRGGIRSKIVSAGIATSCGIPVLIANGTKKNAISSIFEGYHGGTLIYPEYMER